MPEVIDDRADLLVGSCISAIRLRDMWVNSGVPAISNQLAEAIDDLVAVWEEGSIPAECRPIYDDYLALKQCWIRFGEYMSEREKSPRKEFWDALKQIEGKLINREERFIPPILETVSELRNQKSPNGSEVTWVQICYIHSHKGIGPFMNKAKRPEPRLAMQQYRWENRCENCQILDDPAKLCGKCKGGRDVIKDWFKANHMEPYDDEGNPISLASAERMKAGGRIERRLRERVARLLGGSSAAVEANGDENGDLPDEMPKTREELDKSEGIESVVPAGPGIMDEAPAEEGSLDAQIASSEEASMTEQVAHLISVNANIDNRSLADTLGISVNQVKKIRQKLSAARS